MSKDFFQPLPPMYNQGADCHRNGSDHPGENHERTHAPSGAGYR
jgi:hypothetical protein